MIQKNSLEVILEVSHKAQVVERVNRRIVVVWVLLVIPNEGSMHPTPRLMI